MAVCLAVLNIRSNEFSRICFSEFSICKLFFPQDFSITSGFMTACAYIIMYTFLVAGVNSLCRRSIRRMYCDASATNFAAVVQDWKMMPKTIHFDLSTVRRKPPGDVFGSFFGNVIIDGRSYLVMPNDFVVPKFYNMLLGYNLKRPIDLDLIQDIDIRTMIGKQPKSKTPPKGSR